jgi:hypothetical protein
MVTSKTSVIDTLTFYAEEIFAIKGYWNIKKAIYIDKIINLFLND